MKSLEITTKIGCSNMCSYCPQQKIIRAYNDKETIMSLETFKICLDKVPKDVVIVFSGFCEPFLNPICIKMIKYANDILPYPKG
jgi:adenine C2-methylase RlmN of 23S rRNA A2503 and tRNA A37